MKILVTSLAALALAVGAGGCGGSDTTPTVDEQCGPGSEAEAPVEEIDVGAAPTVCGHQRRLRSGSSVTRATRSYASILSRGSWSASRSRPETER